MHGRHRHLLALLISIAALLAVGTGVAQASPAGDDDTPYGTQGTAFGDLPGFPVTKPVTDQAPGGDSITAVVYSSGETSQALRLSRRDLNGNLTGFGGDGVVDLEVGEDLDLPRFQDLLDIRVLSDGRFVVVGRGVGDSMLVVVFNADGTVVDDPTFEAREYPEPTQCAPDEEEGTSTELSAPSPRIVAVADYGLDAARVRADGGVYALWDCDDQDDYASDSQTLQADGHKVILAGYAPETGNEENGIQVPYLYGDDVEIGPDGRPYTLGLKEDDGAESQVYRADTGVTGLDAPTGGSDLIDGYPVDLAVDSAGRPVVWTIPDDPPSQKWDITRLNTSDLSIDTSWGDSGTAHLTDDRQGDVYGGTSLGSRSDTFLDVRPGDKVLVTGPNSDEDGDVIIGLTNKGQIDTGWSDNGYKDFTYNAGSGRDDEFDRIGEPTLQSDGKILVPSTADFFNQVKSAKVGNRIAHPTSDADFNLGVTRLNPDPSTPTVSRPVLPVSPSSVPAICGRRAISLVRADVKGKKVKLTGLVGSKLYGKKVTIQTNYGAKSSAFTKAGKVTASATTGTFTATVARPSAKEFKAARFRAVSGSAKSPKLKLPQSLTSRSVKSGTGTITVKGHVRKAVLGKRNKVVIRRLACGRYRTVGSARPDADGNYKITFKSSAIRGVSFYRAEAVVQVRPGSKKYAIQYARAIAIRTTSQTG